MSHTFLGKDSSTMRRISDWPVAARLFAGFGVVCVLLAAVVVLGVLSLGRASSNSDELSSLYKQQNVFTSFQTTLSGLQNASSTIAGYANAGQSVTTGAPKAAYAQFAAVSQTTGSDTLKTVRDPLTPAEKKLFDASLPPYGAFLKSATAMYKAYASGDKATGNKYAGTVPKLAAQVSAFDGRIGASIAARAAAKNKQVKHANDSARTLMIIIGAVALLIAGFIGFLLARGIKKPADEMVTAARGLAEGDVDQDVTLRSRDELGQMADAFRGVIDYQRELAGAARRVADGDLTVEITPKSEKDQLGGAFQTMVGNVRTVVGQMSVTASSLSDASQQMANTSEEAGRAVGEIAHAVGEVAAGAERQVRTVDSARQSAEETAVAAAEARELADQGALTSVEATRAMEAVNESNGAVNEAMRSLAAKSDEIDGIVSTITGIAEQTNLLALNAAIEAARAGDQGRGFAVVADEVRKLAEESQQAAGTIAGLIAQIQTETARTVVLVEEGAKRSSEGSITVEQARDAFERISAAVSDVGERIASIAEATQEVAAVAEQSSASTEQVSASTQQTSASTQQIAASAQELARTAEELERLVGTFSLKA
jgi:methyl-accepting chemotaxis protein